MKGNGRKEIKTVGRKRKIKKNRQEDKRKKKKNRMKKKDEKKMRGRGLEYVILLV